MPSGGALLDQPGEHAQAYPVRRAAARHAVDAAAGADGIAVAGLEIRPADAPAHGLHLHLHRHLHAARLRQPRHAPGRGGDPDPQRDEHDAQRRARTPRRRATPSRPGSRAATTAIQTRLMTPSANSASIRPMQQPTQMVPCSIPIHSAPRHARPPAQEEVQRRTAVAQAGGLERCQLVQAGHGERAAGDPRALLVPGQERRSLAARMPR